MLDARDASYPQPNGDVNPWDDIYSSATVAAKSRIAPRNGTAKATFPESPPAAKSGLRSRRPGSHRRVSTVDGSLSSHPLQAPSISTSSSTLDGAVTRPSLRRRLGSEGDFDESEQSSLEGDAVPCNQQAVREAEIMVIVHEVTRTDSIAGVALKYGVALADLRKANHLWASDSIHLRKVLYIPLHLSSRKYLYYATNGEGEAVGGEEPMEASSSTRSSVVVQRIPVSQLAFFPPPSQPSLVLQSERNAYSTAPTPPRIHSESSGSGAISSLLQSLPLPSRDILFPRLSMDSSETSSATNFSETSSDQEHEMDILGQSRTRDRTLSRTRSSNSHRSSTISMETLRKGKAYDSPLVPLQTEQLKPSPQMELPRSLKRVEE